MHIIFFNKARETKAMMDWNVFRFDEETILYKSMIGTEFLSQVTRMLCNLN